MLFDCFCFLLCFVLLLLLFVANYVLCRLAFVVFCVVCYTVLFVVMCVLFMYFVCWFGTFLMCFVWRCFVWLVLLWLSLLKLFTMFVVCCSFCFVVCVFLNFVLWGNICFVICFLFFYLIFMLLNLGILLLHSRLVTIVYIPFSSLVEWWWTICLCLQQFANTKLPVFRWLVIASWLYSVHFAISVSS